MKQLIHSHRKEKIVYLLFILFLSQSCVRLISNYDEITDKSINSMQEKVSKFFVKLDRNIGTDDAKYDKHKEFYDDLKVDLNTLKIRTNAIDNNEIVQQQLAELTKMVSDLEQLHKRGFVSIDLLTPLRNSFNSAFTALVKLQLALKRGKK
jgi:hypothetical protein